MRIDPDKFYTIEQLCSLLDADHTETRKKVRNRDIRPTWIGNHLRILGSDLIDYLSQKYTFEKPEKQYAEAA